MYNSKQHENLLHTGIACLALLLSACGNPPASGNATATDTASTAVTAPAANSSNIPDTAGLQQRVLALYQWHEKVERDMHDLNGAAHYAG
jgi:hypothetical protein